MWSTFWITLERRIHLIFMVANFLLMAYWLHILRSATAKTPRLHRNLAAKALCQHLETSLHRPPLR